MYFLTSLSSGLAHISTRVTRIQPDKDEFEPESEYKHFLYPTPANSVTLIP